MNGSANRTRCRSLVLLVPAYLLSVLLLAACGRASGNRPTRTDPDRSLSAVLLTEAPVVTDAGRFNGRYDYRLTESGPSVEIVDMVTGETGSLTVTGASSTLLVERAQDNTLVDHLLVGTIDDSHRFSLTSFHAATEGGPPDQGTAELLLRQATGERAYVTAIAISPDGDHAYLLDRRCQDVLLARDTDGDRLPDELGPTPFAMALDFPELLHARMLLYREVNGARGVLLPLHETWLPAEDRMHALTMYPHLVLTDIDSDDVADDSRILGEEQPLTPLPFGRPYEGQQVMKLRGESGRQAEVWSLGEDAERLSLLGSAEIGTGMWAEVGLSPPLAPDITIGLCYSDSREFLSRHQVWGPWPQAVNLASPLAPLAGGTVRLHGLNFSTGMSVRLFSGPNDEATDLTVSVLDDETADLVFPALSAEHVGTAWFAVSGPGQDVDQVGASGLSISICD